MAIKVQVGGAWQTVTTGEFRVRNPTVSTDWIYAAKVRICWNDGPGGTHRWIDSGYLGVPNTPYPLTVKAWNYSTMTVIWAVPTPNGIPISQYRLIVEEEPSGPTRYFLTGPTDREHMFTVDPDTKYTLTLQALGDTGVPGSAAHLRPWIGHPAVPPSIAQQGNQYWTP